MEDVHMGERPPPDPAPAAQDKKANTSREAGMAGLAYILGFLGSLVYFIQTSTGFWDGAFGVLKALLWPAFVVYEILRYIGA
jgi:hypothetical protein